MSKEVKKLRCRACKQNFCTVKQADGSWYTEFLDDPPSPDCREHIGSNLCRWEVDRFREQMWNTVRSAFEGKPVAYLTIVPPRRTVPFIKLGALKLGDEKRAMLRKLNEVLPEGAAVVAVFDISLDDDLTKNWQDRVWMPHFHILVAGSTAAELRKACKGLYKRTKKVKRPVHVRDAPSPKNALFYSLKHADDVYSKVAYKKVVGSGKTGSRQRKLRGGERTTIKDFSERVRLRDFVYLKGFRRSGGKG